jgi:hypothetical protein
VNSGLNPQERYEGASEGKLRSPHQINDEYLIKKANEALPGLLKQHNERYGVIPAESVDVYRALEEGTHLDYVFAWRETRQVGSGCSIAYKNKIYVPKDETIRFETRTTVEVRETFSGELIIWHKGRAVELSLLLNSG